MINERDARYDLRMRSSPAQLKLWHVAVAFAIAALPVTIMTLF